MTGQNIISMCLNCDISVSTLKWLSCIQAGTILICVEWDFKPITKNKQITMIQNVICVWFYCLHFCFPVSVITSYTIEESAGESCLRPKKKRGVSHVRGQQQTARCLTSRSVQHICTNINIQKCNRFLGFSPPFYWWNPDTCTTCTEWNYYKQIILYLFRFKMLW